MPYRPHIGHGRSHDGFEVDIIAGNNRDGSVVGIEVRVDSRVRTRDRRGLRKLRDTLSERFTLGVILHTGVEEQQHLESFYGPGSPTGGTVVLRQAVSV